MRRSTKAILGTVAGVASLLGLDALAKQFIYGKDGYNGRGYDREGYDHDGFNADGYDRNGRDRDGYDKDGYDSEGFDRAGYDRQRYNREGRNCYGYDRDGYDPEGYDRNGYDHFGYNKDGVDRGKHDVSYYVEEIGKMASNQKTAHIQMKQGNFAYALRDIRVGIENAVRCIIEHKIGTGYSGNSLDQNLKLCVDKKYFDDDLSSKLFSAKGHCNLLMHADVEKTYNQVHFCLMTLHEVVEVLQTIIGLATDETDLSLGGIA